MRSTDQVLGGSPKLVGAAAGASGVLTTMLLLPLNTLQTRMQYTGLRFVPVIQATFEGGVLRGALRLYKALRKCYLLSASVSVSSLSLSLSLSLSIYIYIIYLIAHPMVTHRPLSSD